jgi:hypothetical protein
MRVAGVKVAIVVGKALKVILPLLSNGDSGKCGDRVTGIVT